jgi:hypothetical protein
LERRDKSPAAQVVKCPVDGSFVVQQGDRDSGSGGPLAIDVGEVASAVVPYTQTSTFNSPP